MTSATVARAGIVPLRGVWYTTQDEKQKQRFLKRLKTERIKKE